MRDPHPSAEPPRVLRAAVQRFVRTFGLLDTSAQTPCGEPIATSDAHALMALRDQACAEPDAPPTTGWLGERLCLDKSSATRLVRRLRGRDLVTTVRDGVDARIRRVVLTERGQALADRVDASSLARFAELRASLGSDLTRVTDALNRLTDAVGAIDRETS